MFRAVHPAFRKFVEFGKGDVREKTRNELVLFLNAWNGLPFNEVSFQFVYL